ncbi:MAG TPA: trypsin-like serine protease [Coleofasciculaceae cyanobacterium]|jgi:V8-like Glu-specific endopeptidase
MLKNKKQWALTLLAGTSYILSLSGTILAQTPQVPSAPLSANDPAAKLDPALVDVPAQPLPANTSAQTRTNSNAPVSAVSYDLKTGKAQVIAPSAVATSSTSSTVSDPSPGLSPNIKTEPPTGVQAPIGGVKPNSIIGADNRVKITNTTDSPWRTITKLYMTYPNGKTYVCSGTLIAAKYVLTAGHCLHDKAQGGWAKKVEVIPGLKGTYKPYGSAYATKFRSYTNWTSSRDSNYDIALITLDRSIGSTTGWLGYTTYSTVNGLTGHIAGYPAEKDSGLYLYYHSGLIASSNSYRLYYPIDTSGGQSGSSIYRINNSKRYVFGVHTTGSTSSNGGTRLDSKKFNDIKSWIGSGQ